MIKLLIVDDESVTRKGLIKNINWDELDVDLVEEARDGLEGLKVAVLFKPDIVISDIRMPGMNGIEFSLRLRKQFPQCKIIFLSGYSDKEYLKAAIHLNAVSYVEKPIDSDELKEAVKKAVALFGEDEIKNLSLPFIRQNLAFSLLGRNTAQESLLKELELAKVHFCVDDHFTVFILKLAFGHKPANEDIPVYNGEIINMLGEFLSDVKHICAVSDIENIIVISSFSNDGGCEKLSLAFEFLKTHIKDNIPLCSGLFCAVGQTVCGISHIRKSYETAVLALQKLFFRGFGHIVFYNGTSAEAACIDEGSLTVFSGLLEEQRKEAALEFIEKLYRDIKMKEGTHPNEARNMFFKLAFILFREAEKRGLKLYNTGENYLWSLFSGFHTLHAMKEFLLDKINSVFSGIDDLASKSRTVFKLMKHIRENYGSRDLSVKTLADHVFLTPTYISALFRKETGRTISEFIAEVRMEKSKDLLKKPQLKLFEVARRTGYSDANYYAKAFKKQTGLTPSEFRKKYEL